MLTALVDESGRYRADESACAYILVGVIVGDRHMGQVADAMRNLRYRKAPVVHWRVERPDRRELIAQTIADLPVSALAAIAIHSSDTKSERARRFCMAALLAELSARGVDEVIIESRDEPQDSADRAILTRMRKAGTVRPCMQVTWARKEAHTGLWAADCIAGAVNMWIDGERPLLEAGGEAGRGC